MIADDNSYTMKDRSTNGYWLNKIEKDLSVKGRKASEGKMDLHC